jgi:hypothetical protein
LKLCPVVGDYVTYRLCKFQVKIFIFEFLAIFKLTPALAWKHMAQAPMFPNFKSIELRVNYFSQKLKKKKW